MTTENRKINIRQEWEQCQRSLAAAEHLRQGGFHAESICPSYYATFHAARAALLSEDIEPSTHSGVRSEFARSFVHTGRFEATLARTLGALQKDREDADYARGREWNEASSADSLSGARQFCGRIQELLAVYLDR